MTKVSGTRLSLLTLLALLALLSLPFLSVSLSACQKDAAKANTAAVPKSALTAQIEQGTQLYVANCAKCHGDSGQGTDKAPPVVGKGAFPVASTRGSQARRRLSHRG
jgi:cytochrome c